MNPVLSITIYVLLLLLYHSKGCAVMSSEITLGFHFILCWLVSKMSDCMLHVNNTVKNVTGFIMRIDEWRALFVYEIVSWAVLGIPRRIHLNKSRQNTSRKLKWSQGSSQHILWNDDVNSRVIHITRCIVLVCIHVIP